MSVGHNFDDFFDLIDKLVEIDQMHFIIDPVGLALVQRLNNLPELLVLPLTIILYQLHQVSILEEATHPIFLLAVAENAVAFEDVIFELSHINVAIFEHFLAHAAQLRVYVVSPL